MIPTLTPREFAIISALDNNILLTDDTGLVKWLDNTSGAFLPTNTSSTGEGLRSWTVNAGAGNDTIDALASKGNHLLGGGDGSDLLFGGDGSDTINAGSGDDTIDGSAGDDNIEGANGNDLIYGGWGQDSLLGGAGDDFIFGGASFSIFTLIEPEDSDFIDGGTGDDIIYGGFGNDILDGGSGNDILSGGAGNDYLDGDLGTDSAWWHQNASSYTLNFARGAVKVTDQVGLDGIDTLVNIETLRFSDKNVIVESRAHGSYADLPIELYQFFIIAFNAAPGVEYMDQLASAWRAGMSVKQIVNVFTTKTQFTDIYPTNWSNEQIGLELAQQVIKNSATDEAKASAAADITAALDHGWALGDVIYTVFGNLAKMPVLNNPVWGNTVRQFANQIEVAKVYTEHLSQSTTDLQTLRDVLAPVDTFTDVSTKEVVVTLIGQALLDGGAPHF